MAEGDNGIPAELVIDPAAAGDQAMCRPDALLDVAGAMSRDLLPRLESAGHRVPDLSFTAVGDWDVARGYAETMQRARIATVDTMGFVTELVSRVVEDLVATANTVRDADQRAGETARRTGSSGPAGSAG
ncbi:hypothetical protein AB0H88_21860 [Nonomuraea sp. NPDC050680]|uniref:hypothetical protein n=1 Tax=Nonomuraea sp. NPDC050680 TaxID=3154630 RepID=UPI0034027529